MRRPARIRPLRPAHPVVRPYHFSMTLRMTTVVWLLLAGRALAGLYDPTRPDVPLPGIPANGLPHELFRSRWNEVIRAGVAVPETDARRRAAADRDALAAIPQPTTDDRIRLGILQLRLREFDAALATLQEAYAADPRNFWAMTALGTAYQQTGQPAEAAHRLAAAGDLFPADWPAADAARCLEAAQLKLARLRQLEAAGRGGRPRPAEEVDNLFGVRFVGPDGAYAAGTISPEDKAKLPPDAIATVQQLLMWMPDDTRLYWLLGELYNAHGDVDAALAVFSECLDARRFDAARLRERRQALMAVVAARPAAATPEDDWKPATARWLAAAGVAAPVLIGLAILQWRQIRRRFARG